MKQRKLKRKQKKYLILIIRGYAKVSKFYSALQAMKNGYVVRCGNSLYEIRDGIIFKDGFPHEFTAEEMASEDWIIQ